MPFVSCLPYFHITIACFDELLSRCDLLRVYRSHLVNRNRVTEYRKSGGGFLPVRDGERNRLPHT